MRQEVHEVDVGIDGSGDEIGKVMEGEFDERMKVTGKVGVGYRMHKTTGKFPFIGFIYIISCSSHSFYLCD